VNKLASAATDSVLPPKGSQEDKDHDLLILEAFNDVYIVLDALGECAERIHQV
jgi:hypothetical protein